MHEVVNPGRGGDCFNCVVTELTDIVSTQVVLTEMVQLVVLEHQTSGLIMTTLPYNLAVWQTRAKMTEIRPRLTLLRS